MRILIVDDEQEIREYIASMQEWRKIGCEIAGTAANGEEALAILERAQADLLITDIRMPILDGIGLAEAARSAWPSMPIIFLTAYHEFEYARRAIKLGVADFIMKPFRPEDLIKSVGVLLDEREQLNGWREHDDFFELFSNETVEADRKHEWLKKHRVADGPFMLLYVEWDGTTDSITEYASFAHIHLRSLISNASGTSGFNGLTASNGRGMYLLIPLGEEEGMKAEDSIMAFARSLVASDGYDVETSFSIGISSRFPSLLHVPVAIRQAGRCMEYRMLLGRKSVIAYDALKTIMDNREQESADKANRLADLLRSADHEGVSRLLKDTYREMLSSGSNKKGMQHFCLQLIEKADSVLREFGINPDPDEFVGIRAKILSLAVLTDIMKELEGWLLRSADAVKRVIAQSPKRIVADLQRIIAEDYASELTLQNVSGRLNVNYSYLSRLIKKETGRNFSDLLWEQRIEAAKTMLLREDMKAYEVAYASGFKDTTHFSLLFKKTTGLTPGTYKSQVLKQTNS
ncbi:response regulator [Cohnella terricola]|uniref:Response regulator n=1 Tax=Cohnella terricola TaxID=1289167 RepID=A0A559JT17_9BACL|nr:response regulator [Cohnella terricola]TVY03028.1 response regulator [Cohnella terricola]